MISNKANIKTAIGYARYSSDNQREESIEAQIRAIRAYAKNNGIVLLEPFYIDRAKSATSDRRPEFQEMIKHAEKGKCDFVIVHKLDRFARDKTDSAIYRHRLSKANVQLLSVLENLDGSPESKMMESVLEGMAQYYSANLAREVMKGMKETALQCKHTGGTPALGYDVGADKKYIINERESEIVQAIFQWYLEGYGYSAILEFINERGWTTKRGGKFSKGAILNILKNEKYTGVYKFNQVSGRGKFAKEALLRTGEDNLIRIEGGMPVIISKEDFEKVQKKLEANKSMAGSEKAKTPYLLTGVIFCGECGASMHGVNREGSKKKRPSTYRCSCRASKQGCTNKEIRRTILEDYVLENLCKFVLDEKLVPQLVNELNECIKRKSSNNQEIIDLYDSRIKKIDGKIDRLVEAVAEGANVMAFTNKISLLEQEREELVIKIESLKMQQEISRLPAMNESEVTKLVNQIKGYVVDKDIIECKKFIRDFVNRVDVYNDHVEVSFNVAFSMSTYFKLEKTIVSSREDIV